MGKPRIDVGKCEQLNEWLEKVEAELLACLSKNGDGLVELPECPLMPSEAKSQIDALSRPEALYQLAVWGSRKHRTVRVAKGDTSSHTMMQSFTSIPDDVDKLINLDAGAGISKLLALDTTVSLLTLKSERKHNNVAIHHGNATSSRSGVEGSVDNYVKEIVSIIKDCIPDDEDVLVLGFKEKGFRNALMAEVRKGITKPECIHYLHYGAHKATNNYSSIKYVITFGVLYRDLHDMTAQAIAQSRNDESPMTPSLARAVRNSEQACLLYQALSRGNMRNTEENEAGEMNVWLFLPNKERQVLELLKDVMPGVLIPRYKMKNLSEPKTRPTVNSEALGMGIIGYLAKQRFSRVSTTEVRRAVYSKGKGNDAVWRKAKDYVNHASPEWRVEGRWFERGRRELSVSSLFRENNTVYF